MVEMTFGFARADNSVLHSQTDDYSSISFLFFPLFFSFFSSSFFFNSFSPHSFLPSYLESTSIFPRVSLFISFLVLHCHISSSSSSLNVLFFFSLHFFSLISLLLFPLPPSFFLFLSSLSHLAFSSFCLHKILRQNLFPRLSATLIRSSINACVRTHTHTHKSRE